MNKIKSLSLLLIVPLVTGCSVKREFKSADKQNVIKWEKDENYYVKGVLSFGFYNTEEMTTTLAKYPGTTIEDTVYYELDNDFGESALYNFHHDSECTPLLQFHYGFVDSNVGDCSFDKFPRDLILMEYLITKHDEVQYWGLSENSRTYVAFTPYHIYKTGRDDIGKWTIQNKLPCKSIHVKSFTIKYNFYYHRWVKYSSERFDCATQEFTITDKTFNCGKEHGTIILGDNLPDPTTNSVKFGGTFDAGIRITEASGVLSLKHEDESLDTDENTKKEFVRAEIIG